MLVDLARNDLSRNCHDVKVDFYKDLQYYSHVIHLVSRVSGELDEGADPIKAFIDTFPAGTLSGAPKVRAMQLISEYEPHNRGAYGGCIGIIGSTARSIRPSPSAPSSAATANCGSRPVAASWPRAMWNMSCRK